MVDTAWQSTGIVSPHTVQWSGWHCLTIYRHGFTPTQCSGVVDTAWQSRDMVSPPHSAMVDTGWRSIGIFSFHTVPRLTLPDNLQAWFHPTLCHGWHCLTICRHGLIPHCAMADTAWQSAGMVSSHTVPWLTLPDNLQAWSHPTLCHGWHCLPIYRHGLTPHCAVVDTAWQSTGMVSPHTVQWLTLPDNL